MNDYAPEVIIRPEGGYGGSRSTLPEHVRETILELHAQGVSGQAIARRVNVSMARVSRLVHAHGLSFDQERTHAATLARVRQQRSKRMDLAEQLHTTAVMAVALAQEQMIMEPANHRSRAEAMKAVRDAAAALVDVVRVDMPLAFSEMEQEGAESFLDGVVVGLRDLDLDQVGPNQVITIGPGGGYPRNDASGSSSPAYTVLSRARNDQGKDTP